MPVITEVYRKDDLNINEIVNENIIKIKEQLKLVEKENEINPISLDTLIDIENDKYESKLSEHITFPEFIMHYLFPREYTTEDYLVNVYSKNLFNINTIVTKDDVILYADKPNESQEIHEIFNKNITTFLHCDLEKEIHYDKYCSSKR